MSWLMLLLISIITYSFGVLIQRILLKEKSSDPIAYSIVSNSIGGLLAGLYAVFHGVSLYGFTEVIPNLVIMAFLYGIAFYCMFMSLKLIGAAEYTVLFASRALWSIVAAIIILKETFTVQQIIGTVLIIISVMLVSLHPKKVKKIKFGRGQLLALIGAMAFGSSFINDAIILNKVDALAYTPLIFIIPSIFLWLISPHSTKMILKMIETKTMINICILGVFSAVGAITFFLAYQTGKNAAQIATINQTSIIIIVFLAILFLKERSGMMKKIFAAIISFIGVLLVK